MKCNLILYYFALWLAQLRLTLLLFLILPSSLRLRLGEQNSDLKLCLRLVYPQFAMLARQTYTRQQHHSIQVPDLKFATTSLTCWDLLLSFVYSPRLF